VTALINGRMSKIVLVMKKIAKDMGFAVNALSIIKDVEISLLV